MSQMSPASEGNSSLPAVYPKLTSAARVIFLHPGAGSDTSVRTPEIKLQLSPKPLVLPPTPAILVVNPSKPRQLHSSWVHSAKLKEEAGTQNRAKESRRPERTSFLIAVVERTSKVYGDRYTPALQQSSSRETPAVDMTSHPDEDGSETSPMTPETKQIITVPSARLRPAVPVKGAAFDRVGSSSAHVAKAKYQFLFGKAEDTGSCHNVPSLTQVQQEAGSGLEDENIDETSLFQEIDRELSNLLSGLTRSNQYAAAEQGSTSGDAAASPMIPCNRQNLTPLSQLDMAKQGFDLQNGQSELAGESLLTSGLLFDSWCEALIMDPSSVMVTASELSCFSARPTRDPSLTPTEAHVELPGDVPCLDYAGKETEGKTPGSPSPSMSEELVDQSLEESSKILAEIPGIFSSFLEGGKLPDKPPKKLRFVEGKTEILVNGEMQNRSRQSCSMEEEMSRDTQHTDASAVPEGCALPPNRRPTEDRGSGRSPEGKPAVGETSDATDVFSCQFENILESERLRVTLYSSMDSLDGLSTPAPQPTSQTHVPFAFDIPLTPMIQQRLKDRSLFLDADAPELSLDAEVLSVTATRASGRPALEVTSSFLSAGAALANGVDQRDWLQGCLG